MFFFQRYASPNESATSGEHDAVGKGTLLFGGTYLPLNRDLLEDYITSSVLGGPLVTRYTINIPPKTDVEPNMEVLKMVGSFSNIFFQVIHYCCKMKVITKLIFFGPLYRLYISQKSLIEPCVYHIHFLILLILEETRQLK